MSSRRQSHAEAEGVRDHMHKRSTEARTIAGNITLVDADADVIALNGGASNRDVTLPAASTYNEGRSYEIWNVGGSNSLVIKNAGGSTLFTLTFGHIAHVRQIAGTWYAAGTVTNT